MFQHPASQFAAVVTGVAVFLALAQAQEETPAAAWARRFSVIVESAYPQATRSPRTLLRPPNRGTLRWMYRDSDIYVSFSECASIREAAALLNRHTLVLNVSWKPESGLGDEAFLIGENPRGPFRRVNFRRANMVIELGAPTSDMMLHLTKLLIAVIDSRER